MYLFSPIWSNTDRAVQTCVAAETGRETAPYMIPFSELIQEVSGSKTEWQNWERRRNFLDYISGTLAKRASYRESESV